MSIRVCLKKRFEGKEINKILTNEANGKALEGLINLVRDAGAEL